MWNIDIFREIEKLGEVVTAKKMSDYMQNKFPFLGIPKPILNDVTKPYLKLSKKDPFNIEFVKECWKKDYREAQYVGINYLLQNVKYITKDNFDDIKYLIVNKSWWETVDSLDMVIGEIVLKNPEVKEVMREWSLSDNIWLRRVAIDFQQEYKDKTDTLLLEEIIVNNFGVDEFFINKAIGWSLRDYSKINPTWVKNFIDKYHTQMNKLSIKEASKYL